MLMWEEIALVFFLMVGYNIYFSTILKHGLHNRNFGELNSLSFPCMIQRLCDKVGVAKLPSIDERVTITRLCR